MTINIDGTDTLLFFILVALDPGLAALALGVMLLMLAVRLVRE